MEILRNANLVDAMCAPAQRTQRTALRQLTMSAAGIAARLEDETPPSPEPDRLVGVREAAPMVGLTVRQLYARRDLPFRVRTGPETIRYSVKGIRRWITSLTAQRLAR